MAPLSPEASALRGLRFRELNRQAQHRSRGTAPSSSPSRVQDKAPWLPGACVALRKLRTKVIQAAAMVKHVAKNPVRYKWKMSLLQHRFNVGGNVNVDSWMQTLESFDHRCGYCGVRDKLVVEHVTPLSDGGTHSIGNVVPSCGSCNYVKGNRGPLAMVNRSFSHRAAQVLAHERMSFWLTNSSTR